MVFSSLVFLVIFLPVTIIGYYLINPKFRNYFLLAMSLLFYFWGEPKFIVVMLISIAANYLFGLAVDKFKGKKAAKAFLAASIVWNVGIFFVYKYLDFAVTNINSLFKCNIPLRNIALPIGISFFTFQAISYVIDVYRGNGSVQKNPFNVALFLMMFPQLIADPIVRYETVSNEISCRKESLEDFSEGMKRFIVGLGKKVIISNTLAITADMAFNTADYSNLSVVMAWLGAICYTFQIFFDFSGYSDMAIGLGRIFGFHFNENFNYPYCSVSVSEFWRRWHISLGSWFRDYVYFPLGGSRVSSKGRLVFNLFVTWMLTGIWHGASWNFVFWGFMYFVLLTLEKLTGIDKKLDCGWKKGLYRVFTLLCVVMGWVVFRADNLGRGADYTLAMFGLAGNELTDSRAMFMLGDNIILLLMAVIFSIPVIPKIKQCFEKNEVLGRIYTAAELIALSLIFTIAFSFTSVSTYNPFIYFNF